MSYQHERDQFIARMAQEGLPLAVTERLLRAATTLQRYAELACSSEAADRDRVPCPASLKRGPCCCDGTSGNSEHGSVPRITVQADRLERRIAALLDDYSTTHTGSCNRRYNDSAECTCHAQYSSRYNEANPADWIADFQGDPRGYVLRVIPPSYTERNQGRDRHNRDSIGVPTQASRLRF